MHFYRKDGREADFVLSGVPGDLRAGVWIEAKYTDAPDRRKLKNLVGLAKDHGASSAVCTGHGASLKKRFEDKGFATTGATAGHCSSPFPARRFFAAPFDCHPCLQIRLRRHQNGMMNKRAMALTEQVGPHGFLPGP